MLTLEKSKTLHCPSSLVIDEAFDEMLRALGLRYRAVLGYRMLTLSLRQRTLPLPGLRNLHRWEPILYIVVTAH